MKKKYCCLSAAVLLLFVCTACAKSEPHKEFKDLCIAKLSDGKYPSAAELETASKNISTWDAELQKRGKDIIKKAKTYEKSSSSEAALQTTMNAMAEYGTALGEFIDATK